MGASDYFELHKSNASNLGHVTEGGAIKPFGFLELADDDVYLDYYNFHSQRPFHLRPDLDHTRFRAIIERRDPRAAAELRQAEAEQRERRRMAEQEVERREAERIRRDQIIERHNYNQAFQEAWESTMRQNYKIMAEKY